MLYEDNNYDNHSNNYSTLMKKKRLSNSSDNSASSGETTTNSLYSTDLASQELTVMSEKEFLVDITGNNISTIRREIKSSIEILTKQHHSNNGVVVSKGFLSNDQIEIILRIQNEMKLGARIDIINNKLFLYISALDQHSIPISEIMEIIGIYNSTIAIGNLNDRPIKGMSKNNRTFANNACLIPVCAIRNMKIPPEFDLNLRPLPQVVIEVGYTETNKHLFSKPNVYFSINGIRVVILIRLVRSTTINGETIINQMIAFIYRSGYFDAEGNHIAVRAVSFGNSLHPRTAAAMLAHSGVAEANFVGIGRANNEVIACNDYNIPIYQLVIEETDIWDGAAEEVKPANNRRIFVDLFRIRRALIDQELAM